jgi:hypothetical protein
MSWILMFSQLSAAASKRRLEVCRVAVGGPPGIGESTQKFCFVFLRASL